MTLVILAHCFLVRWQQRLKQSPAVEPEADLSTAQVLLSLPPRTVADVLAQIAAYPAAHGGTHESPQMNRTLGCQQG
jgi:hypothetical protein